MFRIILAVSAITLAGCAGQERVRLVNVAVPVPCEAAMPTKPAWPTDILRARTPPPEGKEILDEFVKAVTAEIELREGYEERLYAALESCIIKKE